MTDKKPKFKYDEYMDMRIWKRTPVTDAWKDKLAEELYNWAKDDPEALKLSQFYIERGISNPDFERWTETHEKLRMAHDAALIMIGNRRENGTVKNKYNVSIVMPSMPRYDKNWKELSEWRAALRAQAEKENRPDIKLVIENFNADIEPVKKVAKKKV